MSMTWTTPQQVLEIANITEQHYASKSAHHFCSFLIRRLFFTIRGILVFKGIIAVHTYYDCQDYVSRGYQILVLVCDTSVFDIWKKWNFVRYVNHWYRCIIPHTWVLIEISQSAHPLSLYISSVSSAALIYQAAKNCSVWRKGEFRGGK